MPKKRKVTVRKAKEILRLNFDQGFSNRAIAGSCKVSPTTVGEYLERASEAELDSAKLSTIDDESLSKILYPEKIEKEDLKQMPDMNNLHKELKKKGVTLQLL